MTTEWSKPTRYLAAVGLIALAIFILYLARSVIPLLILAALLAVIVRPAILGLHRRARLPRGLAVALVYLGVAFLVPLTLILAIPVLIDAVRYVIAIDYQDIYQSVLEWLRSTLISIRDASLPVSGAEVYVDQTINAILAELGRETTAEQFEPPSVTTIVRSFTSALTTTFRTAASVVGAVGTQAALTLFIFLASIYISLSAHTYRDALLRAIPSAHRGEVNLLLGRIERMWAAFFRGQLLLMLIIGLVSWLGLTLLGMPGALYLGIIAGLLELIPGLGPIIATIPAVIVALLQGSTYLPISNGAFALVIILFYLLVQQLENNLIVPRILGDAVELPPLIVMTGVLVGAEVAGLLGALLAAPVIATLREIVRYVYLKILGEPPFPPDEGLLKTGEQTQAASPPWLRRWLQDVARRLRPPKGQPPATQGGEKSQS